MCLFKKQLIDVRATVGHKASPSSRRARQREMRFSSTWNNNDSFLACITTKAKAKSDANESIRKHCLIFLFNLANY